MGISTHILDTALGRPQRAFQYHARHHDNWDWALINDAVTDADGRCKASAARRSTTATGPLSRHFETAVYYDSANLKDSIPMSKSSSK
jgi:5-hydroxyisourate hydrolase